MTPAALHHWTCWHSGGDIKRVRYVTPRRHPLMPTMPALVWLTDLPTADLCQLGLTAHWIWCDRTRVRVDVLPNDNTVPWGHWADTHDVPRYTRELIESDGALPGRWWVSDTSLAVITVHMRQDTPPCLIR